MKKSKTHMLIKIEPAKDSRERIEFLTKFPHTYCNELANNMRTVNKLSDATCKNCIKSFKHISRLHHG